MTHISVSRLTIIDSDNGAWPAPSHYLNQGWNIVNLTFGNKLKWHLKYEIYTFSFKKMHLKMSRNLRPFCFGPNILRQKKNNARKLMLFINMIHWLLMTISYRWHQMIAVGWLTWSFLAPYLLYYAHSGSTIAKDVSLFHPSIFMGLQTVVNGCFADPAGRHIVYIFITYTVHVLNIQFIVDDKPVQEGVFIKQ